MGSGTKNRPQTAEFCKQHLRKKHKDKLALVEKFVIEIEGSGKDHDIARWTRFTDIDGIKEVMVSRVNAHFDKWLNP